MLLHNKKFLIGIGVFFIVLYVGITFLFSYLLKDIALSQNKQKLYNILLYTQAQKSYVDNYQKNFLFALEKEGVLDKDFFNPILMSATYITRHTLAEYNRLRKENNLSKVIYKIASDNPRNPINKATKDELKLLKRFNEKNLSSYSKKITINGKDYIYYAVPVTPNNQICMKCHSDPKLAPKDLVKMYGDKAGFYEKEGHIRAFFSLTLPLEDEYKLINKISLIFDLILGGLFVLGYVGIYFIVKRLDKRDREILNSANIDGLTKIYNRKKFNEDMQLTISKNSCLILIDIDFFKKINDTYGHPVGDYVLKKISKLIKENLRESDKFYRIGGEEFAIISTDCENIIQFAEKLRKIIESYEFKDVGKVTISMGITEYIEGENTLDWYKRADKALYEAKKERNRVVKVN